jgi:hypothetical protein
MVVALAKRRRRYHRRRRTQEVDAARNRGRLEQARFAQVSNSTLQDLQCGAACVVRRPSTGWPACGALCACCDRQQRSVRVHLRERWYGCGGQRETCELAPHSPRRRRWGGGAGVRRGCAVGRRGPGRRRRAAPRHVAAQMLVTSWFEGHGHHLVDRRCAAVTSRDAIDAISIRPYAWDCQ